MPANIFVKSMPRKILYIISFFTIAVHSQTDSLIEYYNNGNIESIVHYKNGVRDGGAKFFWENGNIKRELYYFNGRVDGMVRNYNEKGILQETFSIENNKRDGPTSFFDSTGTYVDDKSYTDGMLDVEKEPLTYSKPDKNNLVMNTSKQTKQETEKKLKKKAGSEQSLPPMIEEERKLEEDPAFYLSVEVMPEPIGGLQAIYKKVAYPKRARENHIEGTVTIRAFIDRDGEVLDAQVIKGIGYGCDESARLAVFYHRFSPGLQKGQRVKVQMDIPIEFKLGKEED
ncbi:TonB family protein [bacterium BMS3Abin03]|nr:TonB family protein [bacterium BMS3Abin03]MCG6960767.1 TonB family protein [bacterium BMS3Abin03]